MSCLLVASRNPGKLSEIRDLLSGLAILVLSPEEAGWSGEVEEEGPTLKDNALEKARAAARATGLPSLADDTGLFVDALGGAPGVKSARYAGNEGDAVANCAKLLAALDGIPAAGRGAEFRTVMALVHGDRERLFTGACGGHIALAPRGTQGFGYDPIFVVRGTGRTFAEMAMEEKNRVSHRARALAALREFLGGESEKEDP